MSILRLLRNDKFIDISLALVISCLGFFINAIYFTFNYFESSGSMIGLVWAESVEHALVLATIPLYIAIGSLYLYEKRGKRELEVSNKLKDLFIDIMRHDLLNPAGAARNMVKVALDMEEDPSKKEILQIADECNRKIINMIENASVLAVLESGKKLDVEDVDFGVILRNVVKDMTRLADEKKMKIKMKADGEFKTLGNPLIHDVFSNLINNAIKYSPKNSDIVVAIEECDPRWKISVADSGEGIPDEYKKTIFDRFKRIEKGGVKGTGLGLAIVKKVVGTHSGKVWVEDNPGGGSVFFVTLPKYVG